MDREITPFGQHRKSDQGNRPSHGRLFLDKKSHGHCKSPTACSFLLSDCLLLDRGTSSCRITCEAPDDASKESEPKQIMIVNRYRIRHKSVVPFLKPSIAILAPILAALSRGKTNPHQIYVCKFLLCNVLDTEIPDQIKAVRYHTEQ
jgi:hypothetical protein